MGRATTRIEPSPPDDDGTLTIDLRAEVARGRELDARLGLLLDVLESGSHPCAESARELQRLVLEHFDRNDRLQRLAVAAEAYLADVFLRQEWEQFIREEAYEKGRRDERKAQEEARQNVPSQRKGGGHAKRDAKRAAWAVLPGGLAAFAAAVAEATKHAGHGKAGAAVAAHKAVVIKLAAAAAIVVPAATLGSMALLPNSQPLPGGLVPSAASPAPAASAWAARPITAPGQRQLIAAITGGIAHQSLAPALTVGLALPLAGVQASQPDPGASPASWGSTAPSQPSRPQAPGQLSLDTTTLDLAGASQAQIRMTATGGPVSWQAANVPSDIRLNFSSGKIWGGVTVTITVSRAADQDGRPQVAFSVNDVPVMVDLPVPAPQVAPADSPSPSGSPSDLPTDPASASTPASSGNQGGN